LLENQIWEPNLDLQNLNEKIEEIIDIMKVQASHKKIHLKYSAAAETESLFKIDVNRVQQVLINLLSNAIKFS
jgi:signal transduction histidine kinase